MQLINVVVGVLLVGFTGTALANPAKEAGGGDITYKGVALGASLAEYQEKLPDHKCTDKWCNYYAEMCHVPITAANLNSTSGIDKTDSCWKRNSFGGAFISSASSTFRDGKLVSINFSFGTAHFDSLAAAAKERLGEPTKVVDSTVQTRSGATLKNLELIWERPEMRFSVRRYGSRITEGFATLITPQELDRKIEEMKRKEKEGAKDF